MIQIPDTYIAPKEYVAQLNTRIATLYPSESDGIISSDGDGLRAFVIDSVSQLVADDITDILQQHDTLIVNATLSSIPADGITETVITCPTLLSNMDYIIYRNKAVSSQGSVNDGSIELSLNESGTVIVEIKDPVSYATGYVEIEGI